LEFGVRSSTKTEMLEKCLKDFYQKDAKSTKKKEKERNLFFPLCTWSLHGKPVSFFISQRHKGHEGKILRIF
jgi:hypothetical protein